MTIEGTFYKLIPIDDNSPFFDLSLLKTIKSKTNPREEWQIVAYGITIDTAIRRIINYAINSKYQDEAITFEEYLNAYNREKINLKL